MDIQVRVITMDKCTFPLISLISNALLIASLAFGSNENKFEYFQYDLLMVLLFVQIIELVYYIIYRAHEITTHLNIKIFKIKAEGQRNKED